MDSWTEHTGTRAYTRIHKTILVLHPGGEKMNNNDWQWC